MFTVTVIEHEVGPNGDAIKVVKRYEQSVDALDLAALTAMINRKPRKPRERKLKQVA